MTKLTKREQLEKAVVDAAIAAAVATANGALSSSNGNEVSDKY
jgi:hypothetical protein